jgi:hypothetical protein
VVIDELKIFKADGPTLGELNTEQVDVVGGDGGFRWDEPLERLKKRHVVNAPSWYANYRCFYTGMI